MSLVHVVRRHAFWLLPLLSAAFVAILGARLITLGSAERSEQLRRSAQSAAWRHTGLIEAELAALANAARASQSALPDVGHASTAVRRTTFTIGANGAVLEVPEGERATASAVATEWARLPAQNRDAAVLFGPVRYGSQWIVAAQAPAVAATESAAAEAPHWRVSYASLDDVLARARFGALVNEGYDFQLSQPDPLDPRSRVFLSSQQGTLSDAATSVVRQPGAAPGRAGPPFLRLALRPHGGWYPAREITAEVGLLALLVWIVAFGAYDLTHSLKRTRIALTASRQRLHAVNERLAGEIEQRENLQRSFEHARYHDAFTGLPNRRYFMDQIDRALREIRARRRQRIAIVLIDIERLRLISDTLGHTAGDELLLQAAQRCAQALGSEYVLARLGADQLAVLLYGVKSTEHARELADRLLSQAQGTYELRQHRLSVSARVGFTSVESGVQRVEEVLREADLALVAATQQQAEHALPYAYGMAGAAVSLVSLEADLYVALDRREFRLLFQPIVNLQVGRVVGAEALLRWRHPVEGLLTPDKFLAIAEEAGVIVPVTRWIIQRVCRLAAEWRQRLPEGEDFYISVNLSAAVLRSPGLQEYVQHVLAETQVSANHLKFELSEGGLVSNVTTARAVLDAFHNMGIELMLDDFGTGYSSLSYLQLFPFDYVKIDRPFVSRTGSERANNAITAAILQLASNLGLQAVAEVVETKAAAQTLAQMGCEFGQGYFFSPPVDAEAVFQQLRSTSSVAMSDSGSESAGTPEDDSPTVMLPAGMILESRIHDDAEAPGETSPAGQ